MKKLFKSVLIFIKLKNWLLDLFRFKKSMKSSKSYKSKYPSSSGVIELNFEFIFIRFLLFFSGQNNPRSE